MGFKYKNGRLTFKKLVKDVTDVDKEGKKVVDRFRRNLPKIKKKR